MNVKREKKTHFGFQMQMIAYTLASMVLTALTLFVLGLAVYGMLVLVESETKKEEMDFDYYLGYLSRPDTETEKPIAAENMVEIKMKPNQPDGHGIKKGTFVALAGLAIFLALFFFVLYFLLFTRKFTAYLAEITAGIRRFAAGESAARIAVRQSNELTQIAESFNAMAEELEEIEMEEKRNEGAKNDLITSIAHDLRTPLTSVIGYLDLVTQKDVNEETRQHYISVA